MTEPLQVGQFAIVDHEPVDRGPNAGVFHGKGPADDRAELYIVAEGTTPAGEAFAGHVVSAVGHAFTALDMSLTGALRRLFEEAERNLRDWNRKSIAQHRVSIGLTCFSLRGGQTVLAQAGPSVAFHLSGNDVQAYYTDEEHGRPIGTGGTVEPQLTRLDFQPGDRLLLLSTPALRELDDEVVSGILALPAGQVLQDLYHRLQHLRHLTAVLVMSPGDETASAGAAEDGEFVIDATDAAVGAIATPETNSASDGFQPSLFLPDENEGALISAQTQLREVNIRSLEAFVPALAAEIPQPLRRAVGDDTLARLSAERDARLALAEASLSAAASIGQPTWRTAPPPGLESPPPAEVRRRQQRRESFSRSLVRDEAPPRPRHRWEDAPLVDQLAEDYRARAAFSTPVSQTIAGEASATLNSGGSLVRVRDSMGGRWKGGGTLSKRPTVGGQLPRTWLVIVFGLGILLTLVGLITVPRILDSQSGQRYRELVESAQQRLANARVQQDPAERRKVLSEAQGMLLEALALPEAGPDAQQLKAEVTSALSVMDAINTPASVDPIASLEQFGDKPVVVSRLTISDDAAYILDSASQRVISVAFAGGEKKVVFAEDRDQRRGRPLATAYLDNGDFGAALLIADANRTLWAYSPALGLRQIAFAAPSGLNITDITTFGRDLYVLDASASTVYRFRQGEGGFGVAPLKELETTDLAAARRLSFDGEFITSDASGMMHRFAGQLALVLSQAGVDKRLVAPEPAQPLARNGDLAVLDAPNNRIIVLRRDGAFDRQYQHKDFQGLSAFAIRNGTAYVFSGGILRRVTW